MTSTLFTLRVLPLLGKRPWRVYYGCTIRSVATVWSLSHIGLTSRIHMKSWPNYATLLGSLVSMHPTSSPWDDIIFVVDEAQSSYGDVLAPSCEVSRQILSPGDQVILLSLWVSSLSSEPCVYSVLRIFLCWLRSEEDKIRLVSSSADQHIYIYIYTYEIRFRRWKRR